MRARNHTHMHMNIHAQTHENIGAFVCVYVCACMHMFLCVNHKLNDVTRYKLLENNVNVRDACKHPLHACAPVHRTDTKEHEYKRDSSPLYKELISIR